MEFKTGGYEGGVGLVSVPAVEFKGERDGADGRGAMATYEAARPLKPAQEAGQKRLERACCPCLQK